MLRFHAELMVHPHQQIIAQYLDYFVKKGDYKLTKNFFEVTKGKYMLDRPANLNATFIDHAYKAGDKETVIAAYIDILDYNRELDNRNTFV